MTTLRWRAPRMFKSSLSYLILLLLAGIALFPIFWAVTSAFKGGAEVSRIPIKWIPDPWHWENFRDAWSARGLPFGRYLLNSVVLTSCVTVLQVGLSAMAGYGFAKFRFPCQRIAFLFVLSTMMIPMQVVMVPLYMIIRSIGWQNSYQGMILPLVGSAFSVFYMRQCMVSIPDDFLDAARIDGANELQLFVRIVLPMARGAIVALSLLVGLQMWDAFLWPLIVAEEGSMFTFAIGLMNFAGDVWSPEHWQMAMATVMMAPMLLLFIVAQRQIVENAARSGLK